MHYFTQMLLNDPEMMAEAERELGGQNLICTCAPLECHGDILLLVANPGKFHHDET